MSKYSHSFYSWPHFCNISFWSISQHK